MGPIASTGPAGRGCASAFPPAVRTGTAVLLAIVLWNGAGPARAQPGPSQDDAAPEDAAPGETAAPGAAGSDTTPGETAGSVLPTEAAESSAESGAENGAAPGTTTPEGSTGAAPPPVPGRLIVRSSVEEVDARVLAANLSSRVDGFEVEAAGEAPEGAYLLEVERGPGPARLRLLLRNPVGVAIVRELEVGVGAETEDPSRFAAVVASHMVEELAVLERPPQPMPLPAGAAGAVPSAGPGAGERVVEPVASDREPPLPPAPPPPPFELAVFGGIQGNDLGGSPPGAGTGGTVFLRATYAFLPWLKAALEGGWVGVSSNRIDVLLHAVPLRAGVDFGVSIPFLHVSIGPRFVVDVWTAKLSQRETGSRYGGGVFGAVSLFPWERFGFAIGAAVDFFPVAVQLDAGGEPAFALGWVRFLFGGGIVGRI